MDRESYDIEIRPVYTANAGVSDPFLDPVCTGFVIWTIFIYIIEDFLVGKVLEPDPGGI